MRRETLCKSCVRKGDKCCSYGKKMSSETKEKIRRAKLGTKIHSPEHKLYISMIQKRRYSNPEERIKTASFTRIAMHNPAIRANHLKALMETKWLGKAVDRGQLELLEKWNRLGFRFEPNYQVHINTDLFYVDGYDKNLNIVLEYDSKYHLRPSQQEKDQVRQNKIIDTLQPKKFWRYDAVNKQWKNVLVKEG